MPRSDFRGIRALAAALLVLALAAACAPKATQTPTLAPAAGVVLQKILNECWGVFQIKELDGTRADQVKAFECARLRLLDMARVYPNTAEPHRVLAWGYLYALKDETAAQAEYERAADIYAAQGRTTDQAEMLVRIAVQMTMTHDQRRGCVLLEQAAELDPKNARISTLRQNFNCIPRATSPAISSTPAAGTPSAPAAANLPTPTIPAP